MLENPWKTWFLKSESYLTLALFRFLFCLAIAWELWLSSSFYIGIAKSGLCEPLPILQWTTYFSGLESLYPRFLKLLIFTLIVAATGFRARFFMILSLVLFIYVVGIVVGCDSTAQRDYMTWNHSIVIFNMFIMAMAPKVETIKSLNLFKNWQRALNTKMVAWPIKLIQFNLVISYFSGGIVKIKHGLAWMDGYTLQYYFLRRHLILDIPQGFQVAQSLNWMIFFSVATVIMELLILIVFFIPKLTPLFILGTLTLQLLCFYLIELKWMHYFGWAYLIYFCGLLTWWLRRSKQRNP